MMGITRGVSTLIGAAVAGFLIWLSTQTGSGSSGDYWLAHGLLAAAGLTMALSQILGGWTKWGWPRLSGGVFLLGFLPVLLVGGWMLLARQPADFFNTSNWSRDLGIDGLVGDLGNALAALAFGIGLTFGLCFDTAGPRRQATVVDDDARPVPVARDRARAEDAPVATVPTEHRGTQPVTAEPRTAETGAHVDETGHGYPQQRVPTRPTERDED